MTVVTRMWPVLEKHSDIRYLPGGMRMISCGDQRPHHSHEPFNTTPLCSQLSMKPESCQRGKAAGRDSLFSFSSPGACPVCKGKGILVTELAFMDPIVTGCEACGGLRYNREALACTYKREKYCGDFTEPDHLRQWKSSKTPKIRKHLKGDAQQVDCHI